MSTARKLVLTLAATLFALAATAGVASAGEPAECGSCSSVESSLESSVE